MAKFKKNVLADRVVRADREVSDFVIANHITRGPDGKPNSPMFETAVNNIIIEAWSAYQDAAREMERVLREHGAR